MKKLTLAALTATLLSTSLANAAVTVRDSDGSDPVTLSATSMVSIRNADVISNGPLVMANNTGSFFTGDDFVSVSMNKDVNDTTGDPAGIRNLTIEFFADSDYTTSLFGPLVVTSDMGREFDPDAVYEFDLPLSSEIFFMISGIGQSEDPAFSGDYNFRLGAAPVPLPAAGLLFLGGAAGIAAARRRKLG